MGNPFKIEILPVKNGYLVLSHMEDEQQKGKTKTETYACESPASVNKRVSNLVPRMGEVQCN